MLLQRQEAQGELPGRSRVFTQIRTVFIHSVYLRTNNNNGASAVVKRHHPVDRRPADRAELRRRQGVAALDAGAHVATLQEDAGALAAQADAADVGRQAALVHVQLPQPLLLLPGEGLQHHALLPAPPVVLVAPPQDVEQRGAGGHAQQEGEHLPQPQAAALLPQEAVVVQPGQEVAEALFGRLQLDQVVVEDQFADARHAVADAQHLLGLVDAFGPFAAQEVADGAGQRLGRGVEVLVRGLQIQL